jgi:hypothetical protein
MFEVQRGRNYKLRIIKMFLGTEATKGGYNESKEYLSSGQ